jgi:hypothetical protein
MTRDELNKALVLADKIVSATAGLPVNRPAKQLRKLLEPGPDMAEILALVPAADVKARARLIGISRQAYYGLLGGNIPRPATVTRLAQLTGLSETMIRDATWLTPISSRTDPRTPGQTDPAGHARPTS